MRREVQLCAQSIDFIGEPVGIRTRDLLIKSQLLYRLSYGLAAPLAIVLLADGVARTSILLSRIMPPLLD